MDLQTAVRSPDDVEQTIVVHEIGSNGLTADQVAQFRAAGWRVGEIGEENGVAIALVREGNAAAFRNGAMFQTDASTVGSSSNPQVTYTVDDGILSRSYHLRIFIPASSSSQRFPVTWKISLPGHITSTNASRQDGNSAVFAFVLGDGSPARYLIVESQEAKDPLPVLGGLLVVGLIVGGSILGAVRKAAGNRVPSTVPSTWAPPVAPPSIVVACPVCASGNPADAHTCRTCGTELAKPQK